MAEALAIPLRPQLGKHLFWEYRFEGINWKKSYVNIIARVMERGNESDWNELIAFYGRKKVIHTIKKKIKFLADFVIEKVCAYFSLKKEELLCYIRKQSRPNYWI